MKCDRPVWQTDSRLVPLSKQPMESFNLDTEELLPIAGRCRSHRSRWLDYKSRETPYRVQVELWGADIVTVRMALLNVKVTVEQLCQFRLLINIVVEWSHWVWRNLCWLSVGKFSTIFCLLFSVLSLVMQFRGESRNLREIEKCFLKESFLLRKISNLLEISF